MATDDYPSSEAPADEVKTLDDGTVEVTLAQPPEELPDETYNLVPFYSGTEDGKKFLKELCTKVIDDHDDDWESSEDWRKKRKTRWKLLVGDLDPKSYPFENCANVHIPVMLERALRIVHRLYAEMFPDRDFVFTALPSSALSQERADILTLDMNWQLRKEVEDFFKQNRRALMEYIVHGDAIFYSWRDIPGQRNRHEVLNCEEVVFPYVWKTTAVDMSDVPRKTRIVRKYKHELRELERAGVYANTEIIFEKEKAPGFQPRKEQTVRPVVDKFEGKERPTSDKHAPYELYEYHGWCKLPGTDDERPIVCTIEPNTETPVCLFIREQEDWKDRARFNQQQKELDEYTQAQGMYAQIQQREAEVAQRLAMPDVPPDEAAQLQSHLQQNPVPPPQPPAWLKGEGPAPVRTVPIESFSHGVPIENLDGSLGLGIGLLLEPFNKAADTAASQFTDSATLANVMTLIMPDGVKMEPGDTRMSPGEIHRVRGVSADQIQNAFKVLQFPPANPQLMEIIKVMLESADGVSSAPDVLSGEAGKSNETYRGIATRVEQATKQLTVLALNYLEMLTNVLKNHARMNAVFMRDEEIRSVIDPRTLESVDLEGVGRALYLEDFEIAFTCDSRFGGRAQKVSEADQVLSMIGAVPPEVASMVFPLSFIYEAVVRALKARGLHDMVKYLGPRPPPPTEQMGAAPPGMPPGMPPGPPGPPGVPPGPPTGPPIQGPPQPQVQ